MRNCCIWGDDLGNSILSGAAIGGAFAFANSFAESINNLSDGYGFGTNVGRFNKMIQNGKYQAALDFWSQRFNGPAMTVGESNYTDLKTAKISISKKTMSKSPKAARVAIAHEWGHYYDDIEWNLVDLDPSLKGEKMVFRPGPAKHIGRFRPFIGDFSMSGLNNAIVNSGKFHTGLYWIKGGPWIPGGSFPSRYFPFNPRGWRKFNFKKWYHVLPKRF